VTLAEALANLDCVVTSVSHSRAYLTQQAQLWVTREEFALGHFASGHGIYTLSDDRSRVTYSIANRWCALTNGASSEARDGFEAALAERRAVEALVTAWLDGEGSDGEDASPSDRRRSCF